MKLEYIGFLPLAVLFIWAWKVPVKYDCSFSDSLRSLLRIISLILILFGGFVWGLSGLIK